MCADSLHKSFLPNVISIDTWDNNLMMHVDGQLLPRCVAQHYPGV